MSVQGRMEYELIYGIVYTEVHSTEWTIQFIFEEAEKDMGGGLD